MTSWRDTARYEQIPPDGPWRIFLVYRGRGWGKTRAAAEWLAEQASQRPGTHWVLVSPTWLFAHSWLVPKMLLPALDCAAYSRKTMQITLPNESVIHIITPNSPHRLQGKYLSGGWFEDVNKMPDIRGFWLDFTARLCQDPKIWVNAAPKFEEIKTVVDGETWIRPGKELPDNGLLDLIRSLPEGYVATPEHSREQKEAIRRLREEFGDLYGD